MIPEQGARLQFVFSAQTRAFVLVSSAKTTPHDLARHWRPPDDHGWSFHHSLELGSQSLNSVPGNPAISRIQPASIPAWLPACQQRHCPATYPATRGTRLARIAPEQRRQVAVCTPRRAQTTSTVPRREVGSSEPLSQTLFFGGTNGNPGYCPHVVEIFAESSTTSPRNGCTALAACTSLHKTAYYIDTLLRRTVVSALASRRGNLDQHPASGSGTGRPLTSPGGWTPPWQQELSRQPRQAFAKAVAGTRETPNLPITSDMFASSRVLVWGATRSWLRLLLPIWRLIAPLDVKAVQYLFCSQHYVSSQRVCHPPPVRSERCITLAPTMPPLLLLSQRGDQLNIPGLLDCSILVLSRLGRTTFDPTLRARPPGVVSLLRPGLEI